MVAYGYLAYLIRVAPPHRPRNLQRISAVGREDRDLHPEILEEFSSLGSGFHRNDNLAEGYRVHAATARGRSIFVRLRRGPVGSPGETYDVESGESRETNASIALLGELRGALYLPRDSYFGFLFVERVGGRHMKDLLYSRVIKPVARRLQTGIRVEGFALTDDWRSELRGKQVLRITEVLNPRDTAHDASTVEDITVRISAEGAGVSRPGEELKERIFDVVDRRNLEYRKLAEVAPLEARRKVWGEVRRKGQIENGWKNAPRDAFTVADEAEWRELVEELDSLRTGEQATELESDLQAVLPPIDRSEYESRRVEVAFGQGRPEKTFIVAGDRVPQLVYEFQDRLVDTQLRQAWDAASEQFLRNLGVDLPTGWPLERT